MRHTPIFVPLLLCISFAHAASIDAKALARYDISYAKCEAQFPDMKGHGDEAYLKLWNTKPDAAAIERLTAARKSSAYQAERKLLARAPAQGASAAAARTLAQQCQGLWNEFQRSGKAKK